MQVGEHLLYFLGAPFNIYGVRMDIKMLLGSASRFAEYIPGTNSLLVHSSGTKHEQIGVYNIRVFASTQTDQYEEHYYSTFNLTVTPDPDYVPEV